MNIKRIPHSIFLTGVLFLSIQCQAQTDKSTFRIVGYYSLKSAMTCDLKTVPFGKLTHINLYFLNPDSLGNFNQDLSGLIPFIDSAHSHNVKVIPSIAGGGPHAYYHNLLEKKKRKKLVNDLLQIVLKYNFDGIDVDLEGSDIDENYEAFASDLAREFHKHKKLVTSAIAIFYKDQLSDKALKQYDFVNVMSYDHTGPWTPGKPGPHSTYEQAVEDLDYFITIRKIPKSKIGLGVPFYGYGFGPTLTSPPSSLDYRQIVAEFPGAELADSLIMPGGAIMYYNGISTIRKKTDLAKEKASGIMIWQLSGDALADKSLLKVINEEAYGVN
ncbi:MAG TPA: glycosyl hydrolase family 18 protein [Ginsengibacter sp.]